MSLSNDTRLDQARRQRGQGIRAVDVYCLDPGGQHPMLQLPHHRYDSGRRSRRASDCIHLRAVQSPMKQNSHE